MGDRGNRGKMSELGTGMGQIINYHDYKIAEERRGFARAAPTEPAVVIILPVIRIEPARKPQKRPKAKN